MTAMEDDFTVPSIDDSMVGNNAHPGSFGLHAEGQHD
jgi:hypothetical protein